ncbi:MAG: squalene--hopene cyclase [Thermosynechococcaceae cyanobacterium MS004]|nr:squalene--hopene cyclase [Thermosynechococcaceae cyanobacterium MS004]
MPVQEPVLDKVVQDKSQNSPPNPDRVNSAIAASQRHLLERQYPEGYWWAELESNVCITVEALLLYKIWGIESQYPLAKLETYLRQQQNEQGAWELYAGDGGEISVTVEGYLGLRLLGVPASDPALLKAKDFILAKGGITQTRIFSKLHLALVGCYEWQGLPALPAWIMLLPEFSPFNVYEMSSWARESTVPLFIVMDKKPVFRISNPITLDELYVEGRDRAVFELPRQGDWTDLFVALDGAFKLAEQFNLVPFREEGLKAAERWILERQEPTGDWGGIIPPMLNALLMMRTLNYDLNDPAVQRGLEAVTRFAVETDEIYWIQPCVSPVWDTALVVRALAESGLERNHPMLVKAGEWLLNNQILDYGDWAVKNKTGQPGGWAFEFINNYYPDVDDTAVVIMALQEVELPHEAVKQAAINRGVQWVSSMQCRPGGWAAFDVDNDQDWLNWIPYGDLKAMIDPNTADVTARVLEMVGRCDVTTGTRSVERALQYLINEQEPEGCWFGRWGVNYIYGTCGVLSALSLVAPKRFAPQIQKAADWLVSCQNPDGGWGETCRSYDDPSLKGQGTSTPSQTAWALMGLLAAGDATGDYALPEIERGIHHLVDTQNPDGSWDEPYFTGTGFPGHFYLRYNLYYQHFPLTAIARYRKVQQNLA